MLRFRWAGERSETARKTVEQIFFLFCFFLLTLAFRSLYRYLRMEKMDMCICLSAIVRFRGVIRRLLKRHLR